MNKTTMSRQRWMKLAGLVSEPTAVAKGKVHVPYTNIQIII